MTKPTTRTEFKEWCLRQLGAPVINVNLDIDQIDDAVDMALQYVHDFHYDGFERWYFQHQITSQNKIDRFVEIPQYMESVTRVFPLSSTNANVNMFDLRYQLRLHDLYDFTSTSYVNYVLTQQHLRTLDMLFSGEVMFRFNRNIGKLYIDWNWESDIEVGEWIIIEGHMFLDPATFTKLWNDRMFKLLATAYMKKQWGTNMKKFQGMQLPGGIMMNGQQIYDEAVADITNLEAEIRKTYEPPPEFILG